MSSVRMSGDLRGRIIMQGEAIFTASDTRVQENLAKDFHDRAATEYVQQLPSIPDTFKAKASHVTYKINYKLSDVHQLMSYSKAALLKPILIPKLYGMYSEADNANTILTIPFSFVFSEKLGEEIAKWRTAILNVELERKNFMDELRRILKRTNTLKQFLDAWPQGENLVPNDVLTKLNEKPVVVKNKELLISEEVSVALSTTLLKRTLMS